MIPLPAILNECQFCAEIYNLNDGEIDLAQFIKESLNTDRLLFSTDNFVVFPSLGAFVEGYVLVASKRHFTSIRTLPQAHFGELNGILSLLKQFTRAHYGKPAVLFEHGDVSAGPAKSSCIDHMHIHLVPHDAIVPRQQFGKDLAVKRLSSLFDVKALPLQSGYIYYQDIDGQHYLVTGEKIISQLMRKALASSIGLADNEWDWSRHFFFDAMLRTIETYRTHLSPDCLNSTLP